MGASKRLIFLAAAPFIFSAGFAMAQTMGEYGGVTAHAAGAGASASTMRPPEVHVNPVAASGSAKTYEVSGQVREDDSSASTKEKDDQSAKGDDWEEVK
ncbi:MAG TPA: hypothetical protein VMT61_07575 [Candidatus Binataceae bacterium]|nr:hypothetical protein [Candidatus Binataceae bacterium]